MGPYNFSAPGLMVHSKLQHYDISHQILHHEPLSKEHDLVTLRLSNMATENGPFINEFPIKLPIYRGFSTARLDYQRVIIITWLVIVHHPVSHDKLTRYPLVMTVT